MHRPPGWVAFDVMGEYELELVSQHPALPAQKPPLNPNKTSNNLEHQNIRISPQIQPVAAIQTQKVEHIKEKDAASGHEHAKSALPAQASPQNPCSPTVMRL